MYRAWQRTAGSRKMLLYHAKRCEFAIHYFTCIEAVRLAGLARDKKDRDKQIEHLERRPSKLCTMGSAPSAR